MYRRSTRDSTSSKRQLDTTQVVMQVPFNTSEKKRKQLIQTMYGCYFETEHYAYIDIKHNCL
jgi:hypothetical protein